MQGQHRVCGNQAVLGAECRAVGGDGTLTADMGDDAQTFNGRYQCNYYGIECQNSANVGGCLDYEIRFKCHGESTITQALAYNYFAFWKTIQSVILPCNI